MSVEGHIESLQRRHEQADREIQSLMSRRADSMEITAAKRRKLHLKDELAKATTSGRH